MITKEIFFEFINSIKTFEAAIERMEEAISGKKYGSNLINSDWYESYGKLSDLFLESHFTENGMDLIYWWLYDDVDHIIYESVDEDLFEKKKDVEHDVNNIEDLWNYMISCKGDYFKDV